MSTAEKIQQWRARLAPVELVGSMPEANAAILDLLEIIEQQEKRIQELESAEEYRRERDFR